MTIRFYQIEKGPGQLELSNRPGQKTSLLTYNMNILQSLSSQRTCCVSLNSDGLIDSSKIIKNLNYEHPLFTVESLDGKNEKMS